MYSFFSQKLLMCKSGTIQKQSFECISAMISSSLTPLISLFSPFTWLIMLGSCEEGLSVTGTCFLFEPHVPCVWNLKIQSLCKKKHTHKVVITMISAFPRASLPSALGLTNITNDYMCVEQLKPDGTGLTATATMLLLELSFLFVLPL